MKIKSCVITVISCVAIISHTQAFSYPGFIAPARYYDAGEGRFISPDSEVPNANDPQSLNRYAYVRNNPINRVDPNGHFFIAPILVAAAVFAGTNATMAAINGGNRAAIFTAAWQGAIQGGSFAAGSMLGGPVVGGLISGGIGGGINGGIGGAIQGAGLGMITAGISNKIPVPKNAWGAAFSRIGVGAAFGAGTAGLTGGDVVNGAQQGAMYAGVSMAYSGALNVAQRNYYNGKIEAVIGNSKLTPQQKIE